MCPAFLILLWGMTTQQLHFESTVPLSGRDVKLQFKETVQNKTCKQKMSIHFNIYIDFNLFFLHFRDFWIDVWIKNDTDTQSQKHYQIKFIFLKGCPSWNFLTSVFVFFIFCHKPSSPPKYQATKQGPSHQSLLFTHENITTRSRIKQGVGAGSDKKIVPRCIDWPQRRMGDMSQIWESWK